MSINDDGGPAFPFAGSDGHCLNDSGMSLRDYFAAKALQSLILADHSKSAMNDMQALMAYELADAMLEERQK